PKADPNRPIESGQSGLIHGWYVRRGSQPCLGCDRVSLEAAGANLLQEVGHGLHFQINVPGQEVLQGRPTPAIRHRLEASVCLPLEGNAGDMAHATDTSVSL